MDVKEPCLRTDVAARLIWIDDAACCPEECEFDFMLRKALYELSILLASKPLLCFSFLFNPFKPGHRVA